MSKRIHRVTFFSPGTIVAESTTKDIGEWNPVEAVKMAASVEERHGAIPYGFHFETLLTADPVDDGEGGKLEIQPKVVETSGMYYINGKVESLEEVEARNSPDERILRSNMRCNDYTHIVKTTNGYSWTQPLNPGDKVVNSDGVVTFEMPEKE